MDFSKAFDQTLVEFDLNARDIANESGVAEASISRFRSGKKDITTSSFGKLLSALPTDAQQHLCFKLLVKDMDQSAMATMLTVIAHQLKGTPSETSVQPRITSKEPALSL